MRFLIPTALLALALTACGGGDDEDAAPESPPSSSAAAVDLGAAVEACNAEVQASLDEETMSGPGLSPGTVMRLGDDGSSLDVSPLQVQSFLVQPSVDAAACVLRETGAPDAVMAEVGQVSGMDGRQEASWDGVALTYSYDGNSGFTGVFTAT